MNENKDANFVWFSDITMKKKKANCAGYTKCDLEKRVAMPGQPGVTIKKIHTRKYFHCNQTYTKEMARKTLIFFRIKLP